MLWKPGGSVRVVRRRWGWAPGRRAARSLRTWATAVVVLALLGPPIGLLWAEISPRVPYVVVSGHAVLADPENQAMIALDGRFAAISALAGVLCGIAAYAAGGRGRDLPLVLGLAAGCTAAAVLAWRAGHHVGLDAFERLTRRAPDGKAVMGVADLHAVGVVVFWPLLAVVAFGLLEAGDVARRVQRLAPGDGRDATAGQPQEVAGGQLDLQAAPSRRDVDGGKAGR
jgi:hypothetical protein